MRTVVAFVLLAIFAGVIVAQEDLVCYEPDKIPWCDAEDRGPVEPEYNITSISLIVNWTTLKDDWGKIEYEAYPKKNHAFCEIWLPKPKRVWGDALMESLGHEVFHCLAGEFHPGYQD